MSITVLMKMIIMMFVLNFVLLINWKSFVCYFWWGGFLKNDCWVVKFLLCCWVIYFVCDLFIMVRVSDVVDIFKKLLMTISMYILNKKKFDRMIKMRKYYVVIGVWFCMGVIFVFMVLVVLNIVIVYFSLDVVLNNVSIVRGKELKLLLVFF